MDHRVKLSDISPHLYGFDENGNITDQMIEDWPEWEFIRDVFDSGVRYGRDAVAGGGHPPVPVL